MIGRRLEKLGEAGFRHPRRVVAVAAVVVALAALAAIRLELDTDVLNLLPPDDPVVAEFRRALETFGGVDRLLVLVRVSDGAPVAPYEEFVDRLGGELGRLDEIDRVDYELGGVGDLVSELLPRAVLFLDDHGRRRLGERLSREGMRRRAAEVRRALSTPQGMAREELVVLDPLGLLDLLRESLRTGGRIGSPLAVDPTSRYLLSRDGRRLLLTAEPTRPAQDIAFDRRLVDSVRGAVERVEGEWGQIAGAARGLAVPEVALGGGHVIALEDARMIQSDMAVSGATSLALVLGLFYWAFRGFGPVLVAFVPLACGVVVTFGVAGVALGRVGVATSGVAALLIGLAIDFVIVSYGRYVEERRTGRKPEAALSKTMGTSGPAVLVGAVTSAATFFAFLVTDFRGLREMGILTGIGILLCMLAVLTLLPAMIGRLREGSAVTSPRRSMTSTGSGRLVRLAMERPRPVLVVGVVVTVAAAVLATQVELEDDIDAMRSPSNRGVEVVEEVADHYGVGFDYASLVISGDDLESVLETTAVAVDRAEALVDARAVGSVEAVTRVVPPPGRQRRALSWLERHRGGVANPLRARRRLVAALREAGLRPEGFERGIELLTAALAIDEPLDLAEVGGGGSGLLSRYLARTDGGWRSLVKLYPPLAAGRGDSERSQGSGVANGWSEGPPSEVRRLAAELDSRAVLTSAGIVSRHLRRRVLRDATVAACLGLLVVGAILWIDLRRPVEAVLALAPLFVGVVWMLGAMGALGIDLNFMSVFVVTMIVGIGVDYGVHLLHRWREGGDRRSSLPGTGEAIALAALSTMVGFGSMSLSRYPGLESTGKVALLGALSTAIVALTLLPAALVLLRRPTDET